METVAGILLRDLLFLDDRDADYVPVREKLFGYGKLGVHGPFTAMFGARVDCLAEVTSVYAQQLFHAQRHVRVLRIAAGSP
jgi:hypothetical protein